MSLLLATTFMPKHSRRSASEVLRVIVSGYLVRGPVAGMAWHHVQYIVGLARLGHEVWFIEDSDDHDWSCYDPVRGVTDKDPAYGLAYAQRILEYFSLGDRWAYYDAHTLKWRGPCADTMVAMCSEADVLIDLGINPLRPWVHDIPIRVLIDTDPAFTQIDRIQRCESRLHTAYFSYAENMGRPGCCIPDDGIPWLPTRQPIVLDAWSVTPGHPNNSFTTIMQWQSYAPREYGGQQYGMKSDSFGPYLGLPGCIEGTLELALGGSTAPRDLLAAHGWVLRNPLEVAIDPWEYQAYIRRSKGEFTVAKHGYVVSRSGWFSERSAAYLASGRPVITEDTGFSDWLPSGTGVIAFSSLEEAVDGISEVCARYDMHCTAAREIAVEYFDSDRVLSLLLQQAFDEDDTQTLQAERVLK